MTREGTGMVVKIIMLNAKMSDKGYVLWGSVYIKAHKIRRHHGRKHAGGCLPEPRRAHGSQQAHEETDPSPS